MWLYKQVAGISTLICLESAAKLSAVVFGKENMSTRQAAASFSEAGARDTLNWRLNFHHTT